MTLNTSQILFVQMVGKTTCRFIVVSFKELGESEPSEANTWRGESALACCSDEVLFFIHLYQALLIDRETEGREKTCVDIICGEDGVKSVI